MAAKDTPVSRIRGDTKNMIKDSAEIPVVVTVSRGAKKCALGKDLDFLQYERGLQLGDELLSEVKNEAGMLNKAGCTLGNKSFTPSAKILKTTTTTAAKRAIANTTVKKEIINEEESFCKELPAYTSTSVKPKVLDVQAGEENLNNMTDESQTLSENKKRCNNVIRLATKNLSDEERRILRAKRFNIIVAESCQNAEKDMAKKVSTPFYKSTSSSGNHPTPTYDTLKKRAERFGENVSTVMKSLDNKEKMLKRKLKFLESVTNLKELEVRKRRAERFRMI